MRNPAPRAAFLPAVFLIFHAFVPPVLDAAGKCAFVLIQADESGTPVAAKNIPDDDPVCVKARELEVRFNALRTGAAKWAQKVAEASKADGKGTPLEVRFDLNGVQMSRYIDDINDANAYYAYRRGSIEPGYIQVNVGFVGKEEGDEGPAAFGIAHELGHGVQHALGVDSVECHRGHEAQADRWAASILREAGFPGDRTPAMVAGFFGEDRIVSDTAFKRESQGCRAHPPGRTRFVNAVLGEELFGKKGKGGSEIGRTLMNLERGKVLSAADIVFDGGRGRDPGADPAPAAGGGTGADEFGADGVLRQSDFHPSGKLIVGKDLVPELRLQPESAPEAKPAEGLTDIVLSQIYRLGNLTDWTSPFIGKVIASGVKKGGSTLEDSILAGLETMAPSEIAKKNTLRLVVAMQDSLGGGPVFAALRSRLA